MTSIQNKQQAIRQLPHDEMESVTGGCGYHLPIHHGPIVYHGPGNGNGYPVPIREPKPPVYPVYSRVT
jgi:hypothetical protein